LITPNKIIALLKYGKTLNIFKEISIRIFGKYWAKALEVGGISFSPSVETDGNK